VAAARVPAGYDLGYLAAIGHERLGEGTDTDGWYATTQALARDARGNVVEQREPSGEATRFVHDADGVYPVESFDAAGRRSGLEFEPRAGEPRRVELPNGRVVRYEYDPIGRLSASYETDDAGVEQLVKCWVRDLAAPASATSYAPAAGGQTRAALEAADPAGLAGVSVSRAYYDGFGEEVLQLATAPDGPGGVRRFAVTAHKRLNGRGLVSVQHAPRFVPSLAWQAYPAPAAGDVRQRYDVLGHPCESLGPGPVHFRVERDTFSIAHFEGAAAGVPARRHPGPPPGSSGSTRGRGSCGSRSTTAPAASSP
jgi:YD repeat-containing protein